MTFPLPPFRAKGKGPEDRCSLSRGGRRSAGRRLGHDGLVDEAARALSELSLGADCGSGDFEKMTAAQAEVLSHMSTCVADMGLHPPA